MAKAPDVSVVIPSYQRPSDLANCLKSVELQDVNKEIIVLKDKGPLAQIRNQGLCQARGRLVTFIDDDTICQPGWLKTIIESFSHPNIIGVSGPSVIPLYIRNNRDVFRYSKLYTGWLGDIRDYPGRFSPAGAVSLASAEEANRYEGPVDYLEACNMTFRTTQVCDIGGFDTAYGGVGEWSEPDLCFRLKEKFGGLLWYAQGARLYHYPSQNGAYEFRLRTASRMANYRLFSKRWLPQTPTHHLYKLFMQGYYTWKSLNIHR